MAIIDLAKPHDMLRSVSYEEVDEVAVVLAVGDHLHPLGL